MTKASANISIALDVDLERSAEELFADLGLDMTTAVTLFLKQSVREQRIPFEIRRKVPNAMTIAALNEYGEMKKNPSAYKRYASFKTALSEVFAEDDEEAEDV